MLSHHPDSALTHLRGVSVGPWHFSILSREGVRTIPGPIQRLNDEVDLLLLDHLSLGLRLKPRESGRIIFLAGRAGMAGGSGSQGLKYRAGVPTPLPILRRGARHRDHPHLADDLASRRGRSGIPPDIRDDIWQRVRLTGHPGNTINLYLGIPSEETFWFGWFPWAILHGQSVLHYCLGCRRGGKYTANASVPFPALVLSPVTLLFGPIAVIQRRWHALTGDIRLLRMLLARKFTGSYRPKMLQALYGNSSTSSTSLGKGTSSTSLGSLPLAGVLVYDWWLSKRQPRLSVSYFFGTPW